VPEIEDIIVVTETALFGVGVGSLRTEEVQESMRTKSVIALTFFFIK
jgi:hypothetical protein